MSDQARLAAIQALIETPVALWAIPPRRAVAELLAALREAERRAEEAEKAFDGCEAQLHNVQAQRDDIATSLNEQASTFLRAQEDLRRQLAEASRTISSLQAVIAAERRDDAPLEEALSIAADLLCGEGYDRDPDYAQEWRTISAALASERETT